MPFDIDWHYLRSAVIAAGAAMVTGTAALTLSTYDLKNAEQEHAGARAQRNALQQELAAAQHDKLLIDQYLGHYDQLIQTGMVGAEQRLDWVDTLHDSVKALKLKEVRYQFSPQAPYTDANAIAENENYTVNISRLKLELGLLHEIDLLRVLENFDRHVPGAIHPRNCQLRRMEDIFRYRDNRSNLIAECHLHWYTIQPHATDPQEDA